MHSFLTDDFIVAVPLPHSLGVTSRGYAKNYISKIQTNTKTKYLTHLTTMLGSNKVMEALVALYILR